MSWIRFRTTGEPSCATVEMQHQGFGLLNPSACFQIPPKSATLGLDGHLTEEKLSTRGAIGWRFLFVTCLFRGRIFRAPKDAVIQAAETQLRNRQVSVEVTARAGRSQRLQLITVSSTSH